MGYLQLEHLWPTQNQGLYTIQVEEHCVMALARIFQQVNELTFEIQEWPQWRDLWVRLDHFVGEEVNDENRVEAKFIRDLYLTPTIQYIRDNMTEHYDELHRLAARMAPTLSTHPLANQHTGLAQRRVVAIRRVVVVLAAHVFRADQITVSYHQFMGWDVVYGSNEQPPAPDL
jgi:hypothetical protein